MTFLERRTGQLGSLIAPRGMRNTLDPLVLWQHGPRNRHRWGGGVLHDRLLLSATSKMLADRSHGRPVIDDVFRARSWRCIVDRLRADEIGRDHHSRQRGELRAPARHPLLQTP